jgi:O-antigen/teichoic acid export membrane protein
MKRRIIAGMGANSFGMAITIGIQLVSLPLFLHYWNTSTYGVWLMLSAIPAYLSMADVGMVTAAGNKMNIAMGKGDLPEANRVFQSAQMFMTIVCGLIALITLPVIFIAPLSFLQTTDMRLALSAMCLGVLAALFGGLSDAVFKSTKRYATGTMLSNYVRLGEWIGNMLGLMMVGSFAAVALYGLAVRLIGTFVVVQLSRRNNHGIHWGMQAAELVEISTMIKPAVSFMAFPLANALSFQGLTLLVGALFGPVVVALFNTYRTIARVAVQITAIFSHALWPEFSRLFGEGAIVTIRQIFRRSFGLGAAQTLLLTALLYFGSPWLLKFWTHGEIEFIPTSMLLMLLYAAVGGIWHIPRVLLMATNQHTGLAYWALAAAVLSVVLAWFLSTVLQLNGVVLAMLLSEMLIATACAWLAYVAITHAGIDNQNRKAILQ